MTEGRNTNSQNPVPQGRKITSSVQLAHLMRKNEGLAKNMLKNTDPTEFLPLKAQRRRKK